MDNNRPSIYDEIVGSTFNETMLREEVTKKINKSSKKSKKTKKSKHVVRNIFVFISLLIICFILGYGIIIAQDNKYVFLYQLESDTYARSPYNDDFDVPEDSLVLINGFMNSRESALIITKHGGLVNGDISTKDLKRIDKILKEDFNQYVDLYVNNKNKIVLSKENGEGILLTKDGIEKINIDKTYTLRAQRISIFGNNVELGKDVKVKAKNSNGEEVSVETYSNDIENVIGIDVNKGEAYLLEEILYSNNIIPKSIVDPEEPTEKYDTTVVSGRIGFVYIKLGSSSYSKEKEFQIIDNAVYSSYAAICERYKIPYGFYYYSTAINEEEANKEFDIIVSRLDKINNKKYNVLPFAIDVELANKYQEDRQFGINVSKVKAYLSDKIFDKYGKVVLYTSGKTAAASSDKAILDLVEYNNLTKSDLNIWMPTARLRSGLMGPVTEQYYNDIKLQAKILFQQTHLDLNDKNTFDYDIDYMNKSVFTKLAK